MTANSAKIDRLRIATPCPISWEQMTGDNRVRFCDHCHLNVYNLSELSRIEAEKLIVSTEGRLCARLFRRTDGTVLTKDCPVGLRALRMRVSKRAAAVFALVASISATIFGQQSARDGKTACTPQTKVSRTVVASENATNLMSGNVLDPNGAAVPGGTVTLINDDTGETQTTSTNDAGRFEFANFAPGKYSINIEAAGFKKHQIINIIAEKDKTISLDTILQLAGEQVIGIVAIDDLIDSQPGTTIISEQMIRRLPIP